MTSPLDRRSFLRNAVVYGGGAVLAPSLAGLAACSDPERVAGMRSPNLHRARRGEGGYGELVPSLDCQDLALPRGFHCVRFSSAGETMSDGLIVPSAHDGMAAFAVRRSPAGRDRGDAERRGGGRQELIRLVRNHEMRNPPATSTLVGDPAKAYDTKGGGGTTTLEIRVRRDGERELVRHFMSLNGTIVNCAGGETPWGSWITCEETTAGTTAGWPVPHGYAFDVPAQADELVQAEPLKALGRFSHEALAVDPRSGIVYETEDQTFTPGDPPRGAGFYRFVPSRRGDLSAGKLQMLAIRGRPNYNTSTGQQPFQPLPVSWVDIDDPDPPDAESNAFAVYRQGFAKGGAIFQRLEGCWWGDGSVFFNATSGGDARAGQVWQYRPTGREGGVLTLIFESPSRDVLDAPDNIVVSPRGGLVLCEDGGGVQFLRGLTQDGRIFDFATNLVDDDEFAGACFSPDGQTLFVNIQGSTTNPVVNPGRTFAIWGPWEEGAL